MDKFINDNKNKLLQYDIFELKKKNNIDDIYYLGDYSDDKIHHYNQFILNRHNTHNYMYLFTNLSTNNYIVINDDHIDFKYQINGEIGRGAFGKVLQCYNHKNDNKCAIKIIKRIERYHRAADNEIKILKHINSSQGHENVVKFYEDFYYRGHKFISFKLYYKNLYQIIKENKYQGFSYDKTLQYSLDIANGLNFIHSINIVHCDLKPENIVFETKELNKLIIIDFGLSYFEDIETNYLKKHPNYKNNTNFYVQSRYYRAPDVHLCLSKSFNIDVWSLGCIIYEILFGKPLILAKSKVELMNHYLRALNLPDQDFINKFNLQYKFYNYNKYKNFKLNNIDKLYKENENCFYQKEISSKEYETFIETNKYNNIINLIKSSVCWDFEKRIKINKLLKMIEIIINNPKCKYTYNFKYENITSYIPT